MTIHPFRAAVENGADPEQWAALFAPDVIFHTPILAKPVIDKALVARLVAHAATLITQVTHTLEVSDNARTILIWSGTMNGYPLQGATILVDNEAGLIRDLTVLMRPWPVVAQFRDAMYLEYASVIPADFWETDPQVVAPEPVDTAPPIASPAALTLASDVAFYSPFLTKAVRGIEQIEAITRRQNKLQGAHTLRAVLATPTQRIELWDGSFKGDPLHGLTIQQLDMEGRVIDIAVIASPWPVVSALRNASMVSPLPFLTPDYWTLPGDPA